MAGELRATIFAAVKGADNLKKAIGDVKGLEDSLGKLGTAGKAISGVLKGVGAAAGAIGAAGFVFGKQAVGEAKQLEQNMLGLKTVFGELTPQMEKFSENAYNIGLSQSEAGKASTFLGSVLKQSGFDMDTVAGQTQNLVGLATDLAATYGYDVQDALLGMTALFRGEYDPIEKFGVAMKQNEINAELAAREQDNLTGAARRSAEQQIRLELLLERSADAQGAMARGAGNLFVEQAKLEAQFKNMQAAVGEALIPALADLAEKLGPVMQDVLPILVDAFELVGEAIIWLGTTISDLFNPTTELGDKFSTLTESFNILWESIFGRDFDIQQIFDAATWAVGAFIDVLSGINRLIFSLVLDFQALGIMIKAVFTGDWDTVKKGLTGIKNELYDVADAALEAAKALAVTEHNSDAFAKNMSREADKYMAFLNGRIAEAKGAGKDSGNGFGEGFGEGATDALADFWAGLYDDIAKQNAKNKLEMLGASEGLIGAVLGSGAEWEKVFKDIVKSGIASVSAAQAIFDQTEAGIKAIEEAAKQAQDQLDKLRDAEVQRARQSASSSKYASTYYSSYASMLEAGYEKEVAIQVAREEYAEELAARNAAIIRQQKELTEAFTSSADVIFQSFSNSGITKQLGEYGTAVQDLRSELTGLIEDNTGAAGSGLFKSSVAAELVGSLNDVADVMLVVANSRDRITDQIGSAKSELESLTGKRQSLFESIVDSIMGGVNVTQLGSSSRTIIKSLERTLEQTRAFAVQIDQLRSMGLSGTVLEQIVSAGAQVGGATAKGLIAGGQSAVSEVNSLYAQINGVASQIGAGSANAMYDAGIETMAGLVDGLMSQEQEFVAAAEYLANAFENSFNSAINKGKTTVSASDYGQILESITSQNIAIGAAMSQPRYSSGSGTFNITVNAGVGANGQSIGQIVVDEIKKFERQSGKVFTSA